MKINVYKSNWTNYMNRIPRNRLLQIIKEFTSKSQKIRRPEMAKSGQFMKYK